MPSAARYTWSARDRRRGRVDKALLRPTGSRPVPPGRRWPCGRASAPRAFQTWSAALAPPRSGAHPQAGRGLALLLVLLVLLLLLVLLVFLGALGRKRAVI